MANFYNVSYAGRVFANFLLTKEIFFFEVSEIITCITYKFPLGSFCKEITKKQKYVEKVIEHMFSAMII